MPVTINAHRSPIPQRPYADCAPITLGDFLCGQVFPIVPNPATMDGICGPDRGAKACRPRPATGAMSAVPKTATPGSTSDIVSFVPRHKVAALQPAARGKSREDAGMSGPSHGLRQQASEKRKVKKSRRGTRRCRGRYGDFSAGASGWVSNRGGSATGGCLFEPSSLTRN